MTEDVFTRNRAVDERINKEIAWCNQLKGYKMFNVIEDQATIDDIELNSRVRGATTVFFNNLTEFYAQWAQNADNEGKKFMLWLNKERTDPFYSKKTDSLYTGLNKVMTDKDLKQEWRLIKKDGFLLIAKL